MAPGYEMRYPLSTRFREGDCVKSLMERGWNVEVKMHEDKSSGGGSFVATLMDERCHPIAAFRKDYDRHVLLDLSRNPDAMVMETRKCNKEALECLDRTINRAIMEEKAKEYAREVHDKKAAPIMHVDTEAMKKLSETFKKDPLRYMTDLMDKHLKSPSMYDMTKMLDMLKVPESISPMRSWDSDGADIVEDISAARRMVMGVFDTDEKTQTGFKELLCKHSMEMAAELSKILKHDKKAWEEIKNKGTLAKDVTIVLAGQRVSITVQIDGLGPEDTMA